MALILIAGLCGCVGQRAELVGQTVPEVTGIPEVGQLARPDSVDSALWQNLQANLAHVLAAAEVDRAVAAAPTDALSMVPDLTVSPLGGSAVFSFSFRSTGDYDQNGEVGVSDLTPIGVHYGKSFQSPDWNAARVADGDANGVITAADITAIGQHYLTRVQGYLLQVADSTDAAAVWAEVANISFADGLLPEGGGYRRFTYSLSSPADAKYYRVVPYHTDADPPTGIPSNTVFFSTAMPAAPANVSASDGVYTDRIAVTWSKVSGATSYSVYRDDQAAALATVGDTGNYDDAAVVDTLLHTYWVRAANGFGESNPSLGDTGYMGEQNPGGLDPPNSVQASDGGYPDHIVVSWTKSLNATKYFVYRDNQTAPLAITGDVAFYNDYSLPDIFPHTYWVKAGNATVTSAFSTSDTGYRAAPATGTMVVLAWNDLGMHCMNQDFSEMMILPPYNVLHAQVISRASGEPQVVRSGVTVRFTIPGNTTSADKTNFWDFAPQLFGTPLPLNIGLTGNGLSGVLSPLWATAGRNDWNVTGIPITPINDAGVEDAYNLATVTVESGGNLTARTQAVIPVSWEISCDLCHTTPGKTVAADILGKHDANYGTNLMDARPVMCGSCHAQAPLGTPGEPGVPSLSSSMHTAHSSRMAQAGLANECYACHPGLRTQCLRDVMYSAGETCHDCHGTMLDVGNPLRSPWVDEPRCDDCHQVAGHEYEQPNTLYRDSIGHNGVHCAACHGSPHAITPTIVGDDNVQAVLLQGHAGTIEKCTVCHIEPPEDPFNHTLGEGGGD